MSSVPLISIVLPVRYVREDWLRQSIESVLSQDYTNKELIVVNDEATQDIDNLIRNYGITKYIKNDRNRGLPFSLNRGFEQAAGELHTWTSADNYMLPGMLTSLAQHLAGFPSLDIVYGRITVLDVASGQSTTDTIEDSVLRASGWKIGDINVPRTRSYLGTIGACFMYRALVWREMKGYNEDLHGAEDFDFWVRAARRFNTGLLPKPDPLYVYRVLGHSMSAEVYGCFSSMRVRILRREIRMNPADKELEHALRHLYRNIITAALCTMARGIKRAILPERR